MKTLLVLSLAIATAGMTFACGVPASLPDLGQFPGDCSGQPSLTLDQLTHDAVAADKARSETAIRSLRVRGPDGLRALLEANAAILNQHRSANLILTTVLTDDSWSRVREALDAVSGQRDTYASHLYWYTDFEQAKMAAKAEGKPILSLRLLGKLDEEFSCANSRFFRTTLYANTEVSQYLRDHFILHWKSVRPVPRVTIDFGDGRKLERTITGNSIHYVLAADGRVIDALPGLYGPKAFLQGLQLAEQIAGQTASVDGKQREVMLGEYHRGRFVALNNELGADLQKVSATTPLGLSVFTLASTTLSSSQPTALQAGRVASGKFHVEKPILDNTSPRSAQSDRSQPEIDDAVWSKIAALHQEDSKLDVAARKLIFAKNPTAFDASRAAVSKTIVENPLLRQIRNFERSISEDTCRNEYLLHPKIHAWLASGELSNVDELNGKVYAELFLTPDSDPWLGLMPNDVFSALENNGVAQVNGGNSQTKSITSLGL